MIKQLKMEPLLQNDYGDPLDCTLTCIVTILNYLTKGKYSTNYLYNIVEKNANKRFYDGNTVGTIPIFIKDIFNMSLKELKMATGVKSRYLKGIGFNFDTIKKAIDQSSPVILNIWKDGRDYYKNHSVTVMGYDDTKKILYVYDNWVKAIKTVDYNKLGIIGSINWL